MIVVHKTSFRTQHRLERHRTAAGDEASACKKQQAEMRQKQAEREERRPAAARVAERRVARKTAEAAATAAAGYLDISCFDSPQAAGAVSFRNEGGSLMVDSVAQTNEFLSTLVHPGFGVHKIEKVAKADNSIETVHVATAEELKALLSTGTSNIFFKVTFSRPPPQCHFEAMLVSAHGRKAERQSPQSSIAFWRISAHCMRSRAVANHGQRQFVRQ